MSNTAHPARPVAPRRGDRVGDLRTASLLPLFVKLAGRDAVVVGGGAMASVRVRQLAEAGARITVVAPEVREEVAASAAAVHRRPFRPEDLDGAWYAIAAATPEVNAAVAAAAEARRVLVNAVDDPERATAYTGGVVRRGDVTIAISTAGRSPALAGLLRQAIDALLPGDLARWTDTAEDARAAWKRERTPVAARRPLLLRALNALYEGPREPADPTRPGPLPPRGGGRGEDRSRTSTSTPTSTPTATSTSTRSARPPIPSVATVKRSREAGFVSIVGAGPGDPALLTRRAAERLADADLVLYDALVHPEVLRLAPRAHCFHMGKRAGRPGASQRAIERLLVRGARAGKRVVRLKSGDPFVFGRGGEEALALAAAGVAFEIVPGVSSAIAAPALAGIPVTHRGLAAGFAVVSGHAEAAWGPILDGLAPGALTIVVLMGVAARGAIAARLLERGFDPETPAAIAFGASHDAAGSWTGTLAGLGAAPVPAGELPGTLVVGAVAALAHRIARSAERGCAPAARRA